MSKKAKDDTAIDADETQENPFAAENAELQAKLANVTAAAQVLTEENAALKAKLAALAADGVAMPDIFMAGDNPPKMDVDKGDMTPSYARWMVATQPLEAVKAQYAGREEHLPEDVREALKGGK